MDMLFKIDNVIILVKQNFNNNNDYFPPLFTIIETFHYYLFSEI